MFISCLFSLSELSGFLLQVGKHGLIIEFTDPDNNTKRNATYLPEVAAHEGNDSYFGQIIWVEFFLIIFLLWKKIIMKMLWPTDLYWLYYNLLEIY